MKQPIEVAQLLIVGAKRFKNMLWLASVSEITLDKNGVDHGLTFLPTDYFEWLGHGGGSPPISAVVAAEWPKLAAYIESHEGDKLLNCASQVLRLQYRCKKRGALKADEYREIEKTRRDGRRVDAANKAARTQQLSTQRGAWTVCK